MLLAFLYFFFVLSGYFILRPIRDAFGVAAGVSRLPWLWAGTLSAMLVANPLYSALVARFPVRRFIFISYQFFALNLLIFYLLGRKAEGPAGAWVGGTFFVWLSVFNLFVVSIFWSFMVDSFRSDQGKRLFGFIGLGGTMGSIVGSGATALLVRTLGPTNLLLVSLALLELAVLMVAVFPSRSVSSSGPRVMRDQSKAIGGSVWAGLTHVARSPYLLGIAGFILLFVFGSTVLYFEQTEIIGRQFKTSAARTEILASIEFAAQSLTALTQALLTGRLIKWIGLTATLAIMPALSAVGFALIGASSAGSLPLLQAFAVFLVIRRGMTFALHNPSKEVLYTVVSAEDKFKSKSFIETFVYRAGDQLSAWAYAGLAALGFGLRAIAWVAVPVSILFVLLAIWLGRKHDALALREVRSA
jgi:AAA family ATP:ADP antiporter